MTIRLDHLVVAALDVQQGVDWVKENLGVDMPAGGVHPAMGTHNHLMRLDEGTFLEVIAPNPEATPPDRPRWFGFDDPAVRLRLEQGPALIAWVVNTDDITATMQGASLSLGEATPITRGDLKWQFGLPADGRLLAGGIVPYVIQWETDVHPSGGMSDLGCRLKGLVLHHPCPSWIQGVLTSMGAEGLAEVVALKPGEPPFLEARFITASGAGTLTGSFAED